MDLRRNTPGRMARMTLDASPRASARRTRALPLAPGARLDAEQVSQACPLFVMGDGTALVQVPPGVVARLGWHDGGRVFLREVGQTETNFFGPALVVEVERGNTNGES